MNKNIKQVLNSILSAFESGDIPDAVAIASFPIPEIPSMNWSFTNRTIQFLSGTADARGYRQWLEVGRHVKKGTRAIHILVPCFKKIKNDEDGEEKEALTFFKATPVFRAEDTKGEPLDYENIELPELPLIQRAYDWGVDVKAVPGNFRYYGYFSLARKEIALATKSEMTFFSRIEPRSGSHSQRQIEARPTPFSRNYSRIIRSGTCKNCR